MFHYNDFHKAYVKRTVTVPPSRLDRIEDCANAFLAWVSWVGVGGGLLFIIYASFFVLGGK